MSGAQIANVVNEAALLAARYKTELVKLEHFEQAIERVMAGNKKTSDMNKKEHKQVLAAMEAGKCLTAWLLPSQVCTTVLFFYGLKLGNNDIRGCFQVPDIGLVVSKTDQQLLYQ